MGLRLRLRLTLPSCPKKSFRLSSLGAVLELWSRHSLRGFPDPSETFAPAIGVLSPVRPPHAIALGALSRSRARCDDAPRARCPDPGWEGGRALRARMVQEAAPAASWSPPGARQGHSGALGAPSPPGTGAGFSHRWEKWRGEGGGNGSGHHLTLVFFFSSSCCYARRSTNCENGRSTGHFFSHVHRLNSAIRVRAGSAVQNQVLKSVGLGLRLGFSSFPDLCPSLPRVA